MVFKPVVILLLYILMNKKVKLLIITQKVSGNNDALVRIFDKKLPVN